MMIDALEAIDRSIVQTINSWNTPLLDEFMWLVSGKLTWIPFYIILLWLYFRKENLKKTVLFLICAILAVGIADQVSNHLFKHVFLRYRPSHHAELKDVLHFYQKSTGEVYIGGTYGFVSSHAANFFAICTLATLVLKNYYRFICFVLFFVASLVSFSRIYLGVHYLSDVIAGGILGILIALIVYYFLFKFVVRKQFFNK